jgi:hypothetical protein
MGWGGEEGAREELTERPEEETGQDDDGGGDAAGLQHLLRASATPPHQPTSLLHAPPTHSTRATRPLAYPHPQRSHSHRRAVSRASRRLHQPSMLPCPLAPLPPAPLDPRPLPPDRKQHSHHATRRHATRRHGRAAGRPQSRLAAVERERPTSLPPSSESHQPPPPAPPPPPHRPRRPRPCRADCRCGGACGQSRGVRGRGRS